MAVSLRRRSHEFVDPFGGLDALARRVLDTPGTRSSRSATIRCGCCGPRGSSPSWLHPAPRGCVAAMTAMAGEIDRITAERVGAELVKLILGAIPGDGLTLMCRDRPGRPGAARAAGAAAGARRAPPAQGRLRAHADRAGAGDRPGGRRPGPDAALGGAAARHRQAATPRNEPAAASASTTTRWSARSWSASGCGRCGIPKALIDDVAS